MEPVGKIVARVQSNEQPRQPSASTSEWSARHMARFWERMTEVYGHRWASAYGTAANEDGTISSAAETWRSGFIKTGLSPDDVLVGLQRMVTAGDDWPPSLTAFLKLCKPVAHPSHREFEDLRALPEPRDKGLARRSLDEIKELLK